MKTILIAVSLPLFLSACANGYYPAPAWAAMSEIEDITIAPSTSLVSQDGLGVLILGDILVYDTNTEQPLAGVEVEMSTMWSGLYVLPETAIKLVDYPEAPEDVQSAEDVAAYCDVWPDGGDDQIDADAPDWCSWWWDTETGQFYQFGGDYAMTPDNYRPTYMISGTDNRGLMRFYLYVDSLPYTATEDETTGSFSSAGVMASIGVENMTFSVLAESE